MGAMYPLSRRKWEAFPSVKTSKFEAHRNHEAESNEWKNFKPIMHASLLAQKNKCSIMVVLHLSVHWREVY